MLGAIKWNAGERDRASHERRAKCPPLCALLQTWRNEQAMPANNKAHRLLYHSNLGLRVIKTKKKTCQQKHPEFP